MFELFERGEILSCFIWAIRGESDRYDESRPTPKSILQVLDIPPCYNHCDVVDDAYLEYSPH